ncbi:MAG TPA: type I DNA topoisomerase, partial [bacterium]|nr:type I DNA topoisomerase [bacterium]
AITPATVREAVEHPGPIDMSKVNAQQARRVLDRLVGYKISPLLWRSVGKGLSAGRVQSVAVRLICEREDAINAFVPVEYWSIVAQLCHDTGAPFNAYLYAIGEARVGKEDGDLKDAKVRRIATGEEAEDLVSRLKGEAYRVVNVDKKPKNRSAAPPFITSTLQQEASRRLGFSPDRTMRIAQRLYEGVEIGSDIVGLITYMRTDSVRISEEGLTEARQYINTQIGQDYLPEKANRYRQKSSAQDAHEAIRPNYVSRTPEEMKVYLEKDELRLYELIWRRFVASQMVPAQFMATTVDISAGDCMFRATGLQLLFEGFLKVYGRNAEDEEEGMLPELSPQDLLKLLSLRSEQHFTKPPARYNEASLIKELEDKGIGRPSTYASIVKTIQDRGYVEKKERVFFPTELGFLTNKLLIEAFPEILDVGFTARVEDRLDKVEEGNEDWQALLSGFYTPFSKAVDSALAGLRKSIKDMQEETEEVCEKCGKKMVKKWGRNGWFLACPGYPDCKNAKALNGNGTQQVRETGEPCPECGKPLLIREGKRGEFYACSEYPKCKYSKSIGIGINCPKPDCDGQVTALKGKRGKLFYGCTNYPKCDFIAWDEPVVEKCPECGNPFLVRKEYKSKGSVIKCPQKECKYLRPVEPKPD